MGLGYHGGWTALPQGEGRIIMRIETLYEFILLASNLNFTDTAKSFFIAQSALSNHISKLEQELGAKLFTRDNRSVALTKVGETFLEDAKKIVADYEKALDNIAMCRQGTSSLLRIGFLLGSFGSFLPMACRRYREEHPEVEFSLKVLDIGEVQAALNDDQIDIGFTVFAQELQGGEFDYRVIYEDRYKLAVPKTHHLSKKESLQLADLKGERLIAPRFNPLKGTLAQMNVMLRNAGIEVLSNQHIVDAASLMTTLVATNQAALALDHLGIYDGYGNLKFLPIEDERIRVYAGPMWRRSNDKEAIAPFVDYLCNACAGLSKDELFKARLF